MVDALIAIIDRLISLVQNRNQSRRGMFEKVLEPVFNELLLIHGDYIKMFENTELLLPGYSISEHGRHWRAPGYEGEPDEKSDVYRKRLEDAKGELRKRRLEFEPVRSKGRALAKNLSEEKFPAEEERFVGAVLSYFPTADPRSPSSAARNILEFLDKVNDPNQIGYVLNDTIQRHKDSWSDVCEAFAALKVKISQLG